MKQFPDYDNLDLLILQVIDPELGDDCNSVKYAGEKTPTASDIAHELAVRHGVEHVSLEKIQHLMNLQRDILTEMEMQECWFELSERDCKFAHLRLRQGFVDRDKNVDFQGKDRQILKAKLADYAYRHDQQYVLVEISKHDFPMVLSERLLYRVGFQRFADHEYLYLYGRPVSQRWIDEARWWDWREKEHEKHLKELAEITGKGLARASQLEYAIGDFETLGRWRKARDKSGFPLIAPEIEEKEQ